MGEEKQERGDECGISSRKSYVPATLAKIIFKENFIRSRKLCPKTKYFVYLFTNLFIYVAYHHHIFRLSLVLPGMHGSNK